jgi:hypothetical protein
LPYITSCPLPTLLEGPHAAADEAGVALLGDRDPAPLAVVVDALALLAFGLAAGFAWCWRFLCAACAFGALAGVVLVVAGVDGVVDGTCAALLAVAPPPEALLPQPLNETTSATTSPIRAAARTAGVSLNICLSLPSICHLL